MNSLKSNTLIGLSWSGFAHLMNQVLNFIIGVILARLLGPQEFGLIGMTVVFTGFAELFMELGLGAAIIQKQDIRQQHLSSIFWLNVATGVGLTFGLASISPLVAQFYGEPTLQPLTTLISFNFLIGSLNVVQNALLNKQLDFRRLAIINTIAIAFAGGIGITLALAGYGVWSLAWQSIALTSMTVVVMWITSSWRPKFLFDFHAIKEFFRFSVNLLGHRILDYWTINLDNVLIGRYIGSSALGVYSKAYQLMLLPLSQISWIVSRVMFPVLSSLQHDRAKVKRIYLRAISYIAFITFPLMLGLLVIAHSFVLTIFGSKWEAAVRVLQVFCIVGLTQSIGTTTGWIYMSQGRTDWMFRWGIYAGLVKGLAIVVGLKWGILGVAAGYTIATMLFLVYPGYTIPGRLIGMTFSDVVRSVAGIFGCATGMATAVWAIGFMLPSNWPHWAYLAVQVPFGVVVYGTLIHIFRLEAYREILQLLAERWHVLRSKALLVVR